jgi:hypothetical protein
LLLQQGGERLRGTELEAKAIAGRNGMLGRYGLGTWAKPHPSEDPLVYFDILLNSSGGQARTVDIGRLISESQKSSADVDVGSSGTESAEDPRSLQR